MQCFCLEMTLLLAPALLLLLYTGQQGPAAWTASGWPRIGLLLLGVFLYKGALYLSRTGRLRLHLDRIHHLLLRRPPPHPQRPEPNSPSPLWQ